VRRGGGVQIDFADGEDVADVGSFAKQIFQRAQEIAFVSRVGMDPDARDVPGELGVRSPPDPAEENVLSGPGERTHDWDGLLVVS
jgi:hypothetical protein